MRLKYKIINCDWFKYWKATLHTPAGDLLAVFEIERRKVAIRNPDYPYCITVNKSYEGDTRTLKYAKVICQQIAEHMLEDAMMQELHKKAKESNDN